MFESAYFEAVTNRRLWHLCMGPSVNVGMHCVVHRCSAKRETLDIGKGTDAQYQRPGKHLSRTQHTHQTDQPSQTACQPVSSHTEKRRLEMPSASHLAGCVALATLAYFVAYAIYTMPTCTRWPRSLAPNTTPSRPGSRSATSLAAGGSTYSSPSTISTARPSASRPMRSPSLL